MPRVYDYVVIHIPHSALKEAMEKLNPHAPVKIVFSTSSEIPSPNTIKEEKPPFPRLPNQKCATIHLPIKEINNHIKLSKTYYIRIDFYYREQTW